jgi:DNA-binding transcriptional MocR family regulator
MKLKEKIMDGILAPDSRMPSIRRLANSLGINQVTVVSAYRQLESEGYIYTRAGSGSFVTRILPVPIQASQSDRLILDEIYMQDDFQLINSGNINIDAHTINFASATPTPDLFPVDDFKLVLNEVLERDKGTAFGYQESQGFYPLRQCICNVLQKDGVSCTTENMQIISGAQQGIDIISKMFLQQGDYVITESPTYTGAIAVFKSRGAEIVDVELHKDGPNLNALEYNLKKYKPKLIYTIPSFQNPTGYSYSNVKREELIKLATKYDTYIIEDDYVSDLDFENKNYIPLKTLDTSDRVIFIKSFSKIFMPGLRLGFMIAPSSLQNRIQEAKHTSDISTSGLIQRAFDLYIRRGYWNKHLNYMYDTYKERYLSMLSCLDRNLPEDVTYIKPGGGLNVWLSLPYGYRTDHLLKQTAAANIVFAPGKIFYSGNAPQMVNNIRLSFGAVHTDQIEEGIPKLCDMLKTANVGISSKLSIPIL